MRRRDLLSAGLAWAAGAVLPGRGRRAFRLEDREAPPLFFDGLILSPEGAGSWDDIKGSGLSGFLWDVSAVEGKQGKFVRPFLPCFKSIAAAVRLLRENPWGLTLAIKGSGIAEARRAGRAAVFLQFQSCEPFEGDLGLMEGFRDLGLRVCQVTHHATNAFGGGSLERTWTGLTKLGFEAVERMDALGIVPDLSHGNEVLCRDVLRTSRRPVVASHTSCRSIVPNARCITDEAIRGVADSGGIVGIFPLSFWITRDPVPTVDHYVEHLEHVIRVGGIDAAGLANDEPAAGSVEAARLGNDNAKAVELDLPWWKGQRAAGILGFDELPKHAVIPELNDVRRLFTIRTALERKRFPAAAIEKIMGGNWVRVLTEALG
jgi:membrane dipeptidase